MIELNFPPLRDVRAALPLAAFGSIACALAVLGASVMLAASSSGAAGVLSAVLMIGFVAPLGIFGAVFVALAVYMAGNGLTVTIGEDGIATRRRLFGVPVAVKRLARNELAAVEPEIVSRYQRLFDAAPVYLLVARDAARRTRVIVAESLRGDARMAEVRSLIERAAGLAESAEKRSLSPRAPGLSGTPPAG